MKTKMMFGLLAVLVAAVAVSTIALPALATTVDDTNNSTDPSVPDATPIQSQVQTRQRLRLFDQTGVCAENCTQAQVRIRTMDGSCGLGDGACTSDGVQYRGGASAQAGTSVGAQTRSRGRNQSGACVALQAGTP